MVDKKAAVEFAKTNFWDILKWIVICCFCVFIILIIIGNTTAPCDCGPVPSTPPATPKDSCKLTCSGKDLDSAKEFYATTFLGNSYTMVPNYGVVVDENTCDINYTYTSKPETGVSQTDVDYRRFTYSPGCNKKAISYGEQHSGVTATTTPTTATTTPTTATTTPTTDTTTPTTATTTPTTDTTLLIGSSSYFYSGIQ